MELAGSFPGSEKRVSGERRKEEECGSAGVRARAGVWKRAEAGSGGSRAAAASRDDTA